MTRGKKSLSKTIDSTSKNLRRALCFGRGETAQVQDVDITNLDAIEELEEDIGGDLNLPQPVEIPIVTVLQIPFHQFHYLYLL